MSVYMIAAGAVLAVLLASACLLYRKRKPSRRPGRYERYRISHPRYDRCRRGGDE